MREQWIAPNPSREDNALPPTISVLGKSHSSNRKSASTHHAAPRRCSLAARRSEARYAYREFCRTAFQWRWGVEETFANELSSNTGFNGPFLKVDARGGIYSANGAAAISFSTVSVQAVGTCSRQSPSNQLPCCDLGLRWQWFTTKEVNSFLN